MPIAPVVSGRALFGWRKCRADSWTSGSATQRVQQDTYPLGVVLIRSARRWNADLPEAIVGANGVVGGIAPSG